MKNLQDKLNKKIPTDRIYISKTVNKDDKEYVNYFLMSSDGLKFLQLTGKNAGDAYRAEYVVYSYNAGPFYIWEHNTLDKKLPLIKKIKYSSLLKCWEKHNKSLMKEAEKENKKYSKQEKIKENKNSLADEFFK